MTEDETGLTSQYCYQSLHYPPSASKVVPHHRGVRPLLFTNMSGSFYIPEKSEQWKSCVMGPMFFVLIRED